MILFRFFYVPAYCYCVLRWKTKVLSLKIGFESDCLGCNYGFHQSIFCRKGIQCVESPYWYFK